MICPECGEPMLFLMGGVYFCEDCQIWEDYHDIIDKENLC